MTARDLIFSISLLLVTGAQIQSAAASDFDTILRPLLVQKCLKCHGEEEVNGKLDFKQLATRKALLQRADLIKEMIEVIDANEMPPVGEPPLDERSRGRLLAGLKTMLKEASPDGTRRLPLRRLNRFQYNNAVKDLFDLRLDVFKLPEKLMTRQENYLHSGAATMPNRVRVVSQALNPQAGLSQVRAFPQDLRAAHGFDNQANQLTLSPLLLDAFLRLSVSILQSPDFTEQNVGVWQDFFHDPQAGGEAIAGDVRDRIKGRLEPFIMKAFRRPVDAPTLDRYTDYALAKIERGESFTASMKKVASAVLSSPRFLFRSGSVDGAESEFELAANLSFFLWASGPDTELLQLAERGELSRPVTLRRTVDRMLADPKIERFLDSFPAQWLQLDNVLAATPDPQQYRYFSLDKDHPASLQMLLEPLLLFDAVFVEDRPIVELIAPEFSYQSEFLRTWYTTDLQPPQVDVAGMVAENRRLAARRQELDATIKSKREELDALLQPVRARLLAARKKETGGNEPPVDLKPYAAWEFNDDLKASLGELDLTAHGKVSFQDGTVVLDKAYLLSSKLPFDLRTKSLEVWCKLPDVNQRGGGVMGIQGPGDFFDTIVLGERKPQHWISGSNGFSRTEDFPDSQPETKTGQLLHLAMVYAEDGTTTLYRNGVPYGKPFKKGLATFPKDQTSVIFGLRHLPPGGNKFLSVSIDKARLYDRALSAAEVALSASGDPLFITNQELVDALTAEQIADKQALENRLRETTAALSELAQPQDPSKAKQVARQQYENTLREQLRSPLFERLPAKDPRYGGVITSAAMLSMTSGPKRTHPIARGAWIIEVIFNDPPDPPPNDVPPLNEEQSSEKLTIREKFAQHRENPDCAGCHSRLDPLGFALENFDITGRWRDKYKNGRDVDPSGTLMRKYEFDGIVPFKSTLVKEQRRFASAFTAHLLRFALARELEPWDSLAVESIVGQAQPEGFKLKALIREVVLSKPFLQST